MAANPKIIVRLLKNLARVFAGILPVSALWADSPALSSLSFEQLSQIQVTAVSKRAEPLDNIPAAISVLTSDDILRSGATRIPEALRYVPGLEVAQINSHDWAISARGNNSRFANKQLVLVDGRTIYTPFSGGVYWEAAGPPVEEIERIEIIRGPGSTVWGVNAVNGVIALTTKNARETQGAFLNAGAGTEKEFGYARYGFQLGQATWARLYGSSSHTHAASLTNGQAANDRWQDYHVGLRLDSHLSPDSQLMFQAEASDTLLHAPDDYPTLTPPFRNANPENLHQKNAHALVRWTRDFSNDSILTVQSFCAREHRDQFRNNFHNDTFDLDLTHQFKWGQQQTFVWGGGARIVNHDLEGKVGVVFPDPNPREKLFNGFIEDEIQIIPERLSLTLGSKVEHNNVTGMEYEPGLHLVWKPTKKQTAWASLSRAVHTPSMLERNVLFDAAVIDPPLTIIRQMSVDNQQSVTQLTYQLGYRFQPATCLSLDLATYYNNLQSIQVFQRGTPFMESTPAPTHFVVPLQLESAGTDGKSYGAELTATWQATPNWRLQATYSFYDEVLHLQPGQTTFSAQSPRHRYGLRSSLDFAQHWQLDVGLRFVDAIPGTPIDPYLTGDFRLAWHLNTHWEFALVGLNLFDSQHPEMSPSTLAPIVEIQRNVYVSTTCKW